MRRDRFAVFLSTTLSFNKILSHQPSRSCTKRGRVSPYLHIEAGLVVGSQCKTLHIFILGNTLSPFPQSLTLSPRASLSSRVLPSLSEPHPVSHSFTLSPRASHTLLQLHPVSQSFSPTSNAGLSDTSTRAAQSCCAVHGQRPSLQSSVATMNWTSSTRSACSGCSVRRMSFSISLQTRRLI